MEKIKQKILKRKMAIAVLTLSLCVISVTTAWATLSLIKPNSEAIQAEKEVLDVNTMNKNNKARAPEPTSIALFGSGILGFIVRFVRKSYEKTKRLLDILGSLIALVLLSPAYLIMFLYIKSVSRGPAIFKQIRVGKNGANFEIFKFRTMHVDAEKDTGPVWAKINDSRLIPGGNIIRKTHLDEIPQFMNVLRGEMSIIGPRPERPIFVKQFKETIPEYEKRITIKPGITGLAQVWHKYDETIEDVKKKIKYDLLYIRKVCLWTDIRIIFRTFRVVITGEGAR